MFCWEVGWRDWMERLDVYVIGVCVCECMHFCVCAFLCVCVHVCMHAMCVLVWVCNLHMGLGNYELFRIHMRVS